jgi:probable DNA repair protein
MDKIYSALSRSEVLVTPTKRLARELAAAYNRHQIERGSKVWVTPNLLPWPAWMVQLHSRVRLPPGQSPKMVLSPEQLRVVWEQVLRESGRLPGHVPAASLVSEVSRAYRICQEYGIDVSTKRRAGNENVEAFEVWAKRYEDRLQHRGWLDPSWMPALIRDQILSGNLSPAAVNVLSSDELCTSHFDLLTAMEEAGWQVSRITQPSLAASAIKVRAVDTDEEILNAALWARARLTRSPGQRLAVIVDDLADRREQVARVFCKVLTPSESLPDGGHAQSPFHISIGKPLAQQSIISQALALLDWVCGETGLGTVSRVLRAQSLAPGPESLWRRAELEMVLRSRGWRNVDLQGVLMLNREAKSADPALELGLATLAELSNSQRQRALPSAWAERFNSWLSQLGWPGYRPLDSEEYQVMEAWKSLLSDYSRLDQITGSLEPQEALASLRKLAKGRVFQAEAGELPLQIMDSREAQGLAFDAAWIAGWHDEAWPQASRPSPFLPLAEQRDAGVPEADPEKQFQAAQKTFARLAGLAPECVFSWPGAADDRPLRPSALISQLPDGVPELAIHDPYEQVLRRHGQMEDRPLSDLPLIAAGSRISGGIQVLEHQSSCAFRAFAEHRLDAGPLETPGPGLDARERGKRVHRAMDAIWQRLKSHEQLCAMDQPALDTLVSEEVVRAFAGSPVNGRAILRDRLLEIEVRRVSGLVGMLMELERERPPFRVLEREQGTTEEFGGLVLSIRPDRVDLMPDGRELILDYKTGQASPQDWLKERVMSLQLPVYLVARGNRARGALYVTLSAGSVTFAGAVADDDLMQADGKSFKRLDWARQSGLKSWDELLSNWRGDFVRLAERFRHGDARVNPAQNGKVCEYCHLGTLCRIKETERVVSDEE